jgi:gamma-glutamylcyclotransferase (GGCT)/AIG2-like uncharacterized protein YtfP
VIHRLFAYGTLEQPALMAALTGRVPRSGPAKLPGHRRGRLPMRTYPGLAIDAGSEVAGTLYSGLTSRELGLLDRYEGPEYRRVLMYLQTDGGRRRAWVYRQRPGIPLDGPWEPVDDVKKATATAR